MGNLFETMNGRAHIHVIHSRPTKWMVDPSSGLSIPDPNSYVMLSEDENWNLILNGGRVWSHNQLYGTSGIGANGLNYIGLSNDSVTENVGSAVLSNEIASNGLARAQGAVTPPTGTGTQTTIYKLFTCATNPQAAQKAALFSAAATGSMNHVLGFTQRSLIVGDTLAVTFTITLS